MHELQIPDNPVEMVIFITDQPGEVLIQTNNDELTINLSDDTYVDTGYCKIELKISDNLTLDYDRIHKHNIQCIISTRKYLFPIHINDKRYNLRFGQYYIDSVMIDIYRRWQDFDIIWEPNREIWRNGYIIYPEVLLIGDGIEFILKSPITIRHMNKILAEYTDLAKLYIQFGQAGVYEFKSPYHSMICYVETDIISDRINWPENNETIEVLSGTLLEMEPNHTILYNNSPIKYILISDNNLTLECSCCNIRVEIKVKSSIARDIANRIVFNIPQLDYGYIINTIQDIAYLWDNKEYRSLGHVLVRSILNKFDSLIQIWYEIDPDECAKAVLISTPDTIQAKLADRLAKSNEVLNNILKLYN